MQLKKIGISRLEVTNGGLVFHFSTDTPLQPDRIVALAEKDPKRVQILSDRKVRIRIDKQTSLDALHETKRIIREQFQPKAQASS